MHFSKYKKNHFFKVMHSSKAAAAAATTASRKKNIKLGKCLLFKLKFSHAGGI